MELGNWNLEPRGPHVTPSFYFGFTNDLLPMIVPWLQLNSLGLTILLHPNTDDPRADHLYYTLWVNRSQPVNAYGMPERATGGEDFSQHEADGEAGDLSFSMAPCYAASTHAPGVFLPPLDIKKGGENHEIQSSHFHVDRIACFVSHLLPPALWRSRPVQGKPPPTGRSGAGHSATASRRRPACSRSGPKRGRSCSGR